MIDMLKYKNVYIILILSAGNDEMKDIKQIYIKRIITKH